MANTVKIGNYRLTKTLGQGSFGKVKVGIQDNNKEKVAVKIINVKKITKLKIINKVKRELKIQSHLNHPHIIRLYEFIETPTELYVILEYALGGDLLDLISKKGKLKEEQARLLFQQLITGIDFAHFHKVSHRDLKPDNIFLDKENNLKIGDFGLSNIMRDSQSLQTSCGSPNYAAPEIISGIKYDGKEVDIWSCGVILYVMLTGILPFDEENTQRLFSKICSGKYYMPNNISDEAKDLINRMLQPLPIKRLNIKEIKEHPWFRRNEVPVYLDIFLGNYDLLSYYLFQNNNTKGSSLEQSKYINYCTQLMESSNNSDNNSLKQNENHSSTTDRLFIKSSQIREYPSKVYQVKQMLENAGSQEKKNKIHFNNQRITPSQLGKTHYSRLNRIYQQWRTPLADLKEESKLRKGSTMSTKCNSNADIYSEQSVCTSKLCYSEERLREGLSLKDFQTINFPVFPKEFGLVFSTSLLELCQVVALALKSENYEWRLIEKNKKSNKSQFTLFKCRSRIHVNSNGNDHNQMGKDELTAIMKKELLKFNIEIFKWSKQHQSIYILLIKSVYYNSIIQFFDKLNELNTKIQTIAYKNSALKINKFAFQQDFKNVGFKIVPILNSFENSTKAAESPAESFKQVNESE